MNFHFRSVAILQMRKLEIAHAKIIQMQKTEEQQKPKAIDIYRAGNVQQQGDQSKPI